MTDTTLAEAMAAALDTQHLVVSQKSCSEMIRALIAERDTADHMVQSLQETYISVLDQYSKERAKRFKLGEALRPFANWSGHHPDFERARAAIEENEK
jgi:hypothetical protein